MWGPLTTTLVNGYMSHYSHTVDVLKIKYGSNVTFGQSWNTYTDRNISLCINLFFSYINSETFSGKVIQHSLNLLDINF